MNSSSKLFKKLNEEIEVNQIKNIKITEDKKRDIENDILFGNLVKNIKEDIDIVNNKEKL